MKSEYHELNFNVEVFYNLFQTVETDLKSCKDKYLICPDTTRDTKTHSSPIQSIQSETITSESTGSMVNLIIYIVQIVIVSMY